MGDGARCLAAAECSGVTVPLTGHDERPPMKDEAWNVFGGVGGGGGWERNPATGSLQNPPTDRERGKEEREGGETKKKTPPQKVSS